MSNPVIHLRWKRSATASDMTEVIRWCRSKGWPLQASRGFWMIFPRADPK